MKKGIVLVILGVILLLEGLFWIIEVGAPYSIADFSSLAVALPCLYFGIRFIEKDKANKKASERGYEKV